MTLSEAKQKFINWCKKQVGYTEGVNNWTKYATSADLQRLYGFKPQNQPWCDLFYDIGMIECFRLANASKLTYQPVGQGSAACRYSAAFYAAHDAFKDTPEMGDQIFFYDAQGEINHTGVVEAVGGGIVYTIEGNTSDRVLRRQYALGDSRIAGYGRPAWKYVIDATLQPGEPTIKEPTSEPAEDTAYYCTASIKLPVIEYGATGEYVKLMQERLQKKGFSCGWTGADGEYGQLTKNALTKFQKKADLEADGICGALTWAALLGV